MIVPFLALNDVQIGGRSSYTKEKAENLVWSEYVLSEKLPEPKTLEGRLNYDSSSSLSLYIMGVDKNEYKDYISACKDKGYTVDIYNSSSSFSAKNKEGYSLYLFYDEDDKEYSISLSAPKEESTSEEIKKESKPAEVQKEEKSKLDTSSNGLRTDFKKAMDDYESFMNEYVEFMKKYSSNPSHTSLLNDYSNYMTKYAKAMESFEKWDEEDMSDEEAKYYLEVQTRINKKLLEVK